MTKHSKLLNHLNQGYVLTTKQIYGKFDLKNPTRAIHYLREKGNCIYTHKTIVNGHESAKYRIGKPTATMIAAAKAVLGAEAFTSK